jgi:hypothetical protein
MVGSLVESDVKSEGSEKDLKLCDPARSPGLRGSSSRATAQGPRKQSSLSEDLRAK